MFKKVIGYGLVGLAASKFTEPQGFKSQEDFDFPVTKAEADGGAEGLVRREELLHLEDEERVDAGRGHR